MSCSRFSCMCVKCSVVADCKRVNAKMAPNQVVSKTIVYLFVPADTFQWPFYCPRFGRFGRLLVAAPRFSCACAGEGLSRPRESIAASSAAFGCGPAVGYVLTQICLHGYVLPLIFPAPLINLHQHRRKSHLAQSSLAYWHLRQVL